MGEKLTLARYLQGRGEVKALTHIEAQAFGVPYPLQPGWPARHGAIEITEVMIEDLKARILTAKESTASKARRGLEGIGDATPAPSQSTARPALALQPAAPTEPTLFPGFVLRRPKRYRSRRPAP
jgi:hypothetical protein